MVGSEWETQRRQSAADACHIYALVIQGTKLDTLHERLVWLTPHECVRDPASTGNLISRCPSIRFVFVAAQNDTLPTSSAAMLYQEQCWKTKSSMKCNLDPRSS